MGGLNYIGLMSAIINFYQFMVYMVWDLMIGVPISNTKQKILAGDNQEDGEKSEKVNKESKKYEEVD